MRQKQDIRLAARLVKGDAGAFNVFFDTYFPRIYRFALVRVQGDHDLAEETAQAVLCQALSGMDTYRGEAPMFSWLCTFARHELYRQLKARGRAQGDVPLSEENPAVRAALESLLAAVGDSPDTLTEKAQIRRLVQVAMDHLPSLYADVLERKYVHGEPVRVIARIIGKSEKAVESTLTRARNAFRDCFVTLIEEETHGPRGDFAA